MKFLKGFIVGVIVGCGATLTDQQRRRIARTAGRAAGRSTQPVVDALTDNAQRVADAGIERAVQAIDRTGDATAEAIAAT
jgi:hypothetical protein